MIISQQFCGQVWSLDKVMEYFSNELKAQENCNLDKVTSDFSRKREPYTTSGLFTYTRNKKTSVCIVEIIFHLGAIRSQIARLGNLFYASMEDVLSVETMATLPEIVLQNMYAKNVRGVNIIYRYARLMLRGNTMRMIRLRRAAILQIRIEVVLLATQGVKTRAYFYKLHYHTYVQQTPLRSNTIPVYYLTVAASARIYQQRLGTPYS